AEAETALHADRRDELVAGDECAEVLAFERSDLLAELVELLDAVAVEVLPDVLAELLPDADVDLLEHRRALGLRLVDRVQLDGALPRRPPVRPADDHALVVELAGLGEGLGEAARAVGELRLGGVGRGRAEARVGADGANRRR